MSNVSFLPPNWWVPMIESVAVMLLIMAPFAFLGWGLRKLGSLGKKKPNSARKLQVVSTGERSKPKGLITLRKIDNNTGEQFEKFLKRLFNVIYKGQLTRIEETPKTKDHGCDLVLNFIDGRKVGVQAKRYTGNVGNAAAKDIVHAKAMYGLTDLMVVTNRDFTPAFFESVRSHKIQFINREKLQELIDIYNEDIVDWHRK